MEDLKLAETVEKIGKVNNFTDLTPKNIKTITNAIEVVNEFNSKIESYGKLIFESLYVDSIENWFDRLSKKDLIKSLNTDEPKLRQRDIGKLYVFCYKNKILYRYDLPFNSFGADRRFNTNYTFKDNKLIVTNTWESQSTRMSHIPWITKSKTYIIDLETSGIEYEENI